MQRLRVFSTQKLSLGCSFALRPSPLRTLRVSKSVDAACFVPRQQRRWGDQVFRCHRRRGSREHRGDEVGRVGAPQPLDQLTVDGLLEVHRRLLQGTRLEEFGGKPRESQNWIGGSNYNPCSAAFVPPPWEEVSPLLEDLCSFCNEDELPPVVQAAVAHAQFETIHPFVDGNGRTGRALIHVILRRRGLAPRVLPPISLVLATWSRDYVNGLTATRRVGPPDSHEAVDGLNQWIGVFAAACGRAVEDAIEFEGRIAHIQTEWRSALGPVRRKSAVDLLIATLPGAPILTVKGASQLIGRSFERTNEAMARLQAAGVIRPVTVGRRNRAFEARAVIDAFADLERQLASPSGNTLSAPPIRPAPRRPA